nr:RNA-directed DNA polymerase, eukaryota [Tanacetum cinerariifolium]
MTRVAGLCWGEWWKSWGVCRVWCSGGKSGEKGCYRLAGKVGVNSVDLNVGGRKTGPFILNEVIHWCKAKKNSMIFKVDFEKAFDSVRWDFLEDVMKNFGFGHRWEILFRHFSSSSSWKLSYLSFDNVVKAGLRINIHKSKLMGVAVERDLVKSAAFHIGCSTLSALFWYLGVNVRGNMSRIASWEGIIGKVLKRLSKWKMKVLSVGGRLTLLKSVLGATPLYYMSLYLAPIMSWRLLFSKISFLGYMLLTLLKVSAWQI